MYNYYHRKLDIRQTIIRQAGYVIYLLIESQEFIQIKFIDIDKITLQPERWIA